MTIRRTEGIRDIAVPELIRGRQLALRENTPVERRRAAVHVADRLAAEYPMPLDELMPRLAGRQLAQDPLVRAEARGLLAMLGLLPQGRDAA